MGKLKQQGLSKGIWADFFFPFGRTVTFPLITFENQHGEKAERVFCHCSLVMKKEQLGEESGGNVTRNCALPVQTRLAELIPDFMHLSFVFDLDEDKAHHIVNLLQWL